MFNSKNLKNLTPQEQRYTVMAYSFAFLTFVILFCNYIQLIQPNIGQIAFLVSMDLTVLFLGLGNKKTNPENSKMFLGLAALGALFIIVRVVMIFVMG